MSFIKTYLRYYSLLLCGLLLFCSCETDLDPDDPGNNPNNPNQPANIDPDKASGYLRLDSPTVISGTLGSAVEGQLKMDVEDTIFSIKGYPIGNRLEFLHDPTQDVSGFYIYVGGASSYYDVPETIIEGQYTPPEEGDTTAILDMDLDPTIDNVDYPYTIEITIQPHDPSGNPLDEFTRWVTVEDPADSGGGSGCNTIARPLSDNTIHWDWDFTIREFNGDILNVFAPGLATPINSQGSGCCSDNGKSYSVSDSPACVPNTTASHMTWVQLEVDDYSVRPYELWQIYDDGSLMVLSNEIKKTYNRPTTNFCSGTVGYTFDNEDTGGTGTHDFIPGGDHINFDFPNWEGGWRPRGGDLIYTCNTMIITWGREDKFSAVYRRIKYDPYPSYNPIEFYYQWKPWFD